MRVGRKPNAAEIKKTRSCVVRLEKVCKTSQNKSPSPEEFRSATRTYRLTTAAMGATSKGRRGGISQQEDKSVSTPARKKVVGSSVSSHSSFPTQKTVISNMSNIRSSQKIKEIPRPNKTPQSTPPREESPPPTIAAGRSRRAIKPNPKYASEDVVTPKVVRNVALLSSSTSRGGPNAQSKTRKASTSSDDFYNRNSDDEYDNYVNNAEDDNDEDLNNDKAYQASEKDDHDSDFSVIETPVRTSRTRARSKKNQETTTDIITQQSDNKLPTQPSNLKRTSTTVTPNASNIRSAPSQLQQIRRSIASANAQRNSNMLVGSGGTAQKRKLEEFTDTSDTESSYSAKRKQLLLSNSSGLNVKLPVRENRFNMNSTPLTKSRLISNPQVYKAQPQQTINGSNKFNNTITTSRRPAETSSKPNTETYAKSSPRQPAASSNINQKTNNQNPLETHAKLLPSKAQKFHSATSKQLLQKERQNNLAAVSSVSSSYSPSSNTKSRTSENTKALSMQSSLKSKSATPSQNSKAVSSEVIHEIKDDSPNSTVDDFETMPTFTIVNVNDIINKKGDVLITKSNSNKTPTVIEFSESISLDDDDDDDEDEDDNKNVNDDVEDMVARAPSRQKQILSKKLPTLNNRNEIDNKKSLSRPGESSRKLLAHAKTSMNSSNQAPQILNHKLGLRNNRVTAKTTTTLTATLSTPDKPAPRILNSMVAKKTQPVKPMIANMEDSADESFPLSLDEDDDEQEETEYETDSRHQKVARVNEKDRKRDYQNVTEVDTEDTESQNTEEDDTMLQTSNAAALSHSASKAAALGPKQNTALQQRRRRAATAANTPIIVSSNKKRLTTAAAKENSLAATNQQVSDTTTKPSIASTLPARKSNAEKVVISKQGDKIIKKITCFETWYVINMPVEQNRPTIMKNQLEMPLIRLANHVKNICLPNKLWSSKVTLYELSPQTLAKGSFATYTGDLYEHKISEEDRGKYQPSCVMFRRSVEKNQVSRMPYDRAVIFKNKTFYTNIEGKNVRLVGAPSIINSEGEIEILLEVVDSLTLQSDFIEHISIVQ